MTSTRPVVVIGESTGPLPVTGKAGGRHRAPEPTPWWQRLRRRLA